MRRRVTHLALVQDDNPRVLVVLLLDFVFGIDARPLHLQQTAEQLQVIGQTETHRFNVRSGLLRLTGNAAY